jgi:predicted Zn finger-like uncharacterized protein
MPIACRCPHCGHSYSLKDALAGRRVRCKECQQGFTVESARPELAEVTPDGTPVFRHKPRKKSGPTLVGDVTPHLDRITAHLEEHLGPCAGVFHEIISDEVHLDLLVFPPTGEPESEQRPAGGNHYTVVTAGMSARPMSVPAGEDAPSPYAELMVALPSDWPGLSPTGGFDTDVMSDVRYWWPLQWLKSIARMPHEYNTFVTIGHTIPNDESADPYAPDTKLGCMLVMPTILAPALNEPLVADDALIHFYALCPLYPQEMNLKLKRGLPALFELFGKAEMTELIRPDRPNLCQKKGWWPF